MSIGPLELAIVAVILLIIFGPGRLPSVGRSIGKAARDFKESVTGIRKDVGADELRAELGSGTEEDERAERPASRERS